MFRGGYPLIHELVVVLSAGGCIVFLKMRCILREAHHDLPWGIPKKGVHKMGPLFYGVSPGIHYLRWYLGLQLGSQIWWVLHYTILGVTFCNLGVTFWKSEVNPGI